MMTQEMSEAEQEYLQALVHRIATHIVEGSAAVQELKSTVARLKNERSDIEYAVYEHWLKAAKTIEAAGKEKSSWEKLIKSLGMGYGGDANADKEISASRSGGGAPPKKAEGGLLAIASQELWAPHIVSAPRNNAHVGTTGTTTKDQIRFVETVDHHGSYHFQKRSREMLDLSERIGYDTERLAQAAMTIGEPNSNSNANSNSKSNKGKRKLAEDSSELVGEGGRKKSLIQFTNGRKVGGEKVVALKKGGRCFYCERKGHRAAECKDNPDLQGQP